MSRPPHGLAHVRRVRVGSANGPKIAAAVQALEPYAEGVVVVGEAVDSGVPEQPVGWAEISLGASHRAERAFELGDCDLAIGYEDGLVQLPELVGWSSPQGVTDDGGAPPLNVGCAAVSDGQTVALGLSSGFVYPPEVAQRAVAERAPIGDLFDALWRSRSDELPEATPSAQGEGNIGKLSLGALTRSMYARQAITCALVRFLHPDLYEQRTPGARSVA